MAKKRAKTKIKVKNKPKSNSLKFIGIKIAIFGLMFLISLFLYKISTNEMYIYLFKILAILFGFVIIALIIALLVLLFMRVFKKK